MTSNETPAPLSPDEAMLIGVIVSAFGVRGQMKVRALTEDIEHLRRRIRTVYVGEKRTPYKLAQVQVHKPGLLIVSLGGVTTREGAENLRGAEVAISERDAAPLASDEYFIHQLYGLTVVTESGEELGTVREVLSTGSNDVLVVPRPGKTEALIPMIHDVVQQLDLEHGRVVIRPMEGLLS